MRTLLLVGALLLVVTLGGCAHVWDNGPDGREAYAIWPACLPPDVGR